MRTVWHAAVLVLLMVPAPVVAQPAAAAIAQRLDSILAARVAHDGAGCALGVFHNGVVVHATARGLADIEHGVPLSTATRMPVASLTKQFVGWTVARLADDGVLDLSADIRTYIEFPDYGSPITLRHLLHHTSGIRDIRSLATRAGWAWGDAIDEREMLSLVQRQRALNFPPGTRHLYSNSNYLLLGAIVERVTGQDLGIALKALLIDPASMPYAVMPETHGRLSSNRAHTYRLAGDEWILDENDAAPSGAAGLLMSVEDFAAWERNFGTHAFGSMRIDSLATSTWHLDDGTPVMYGFGVGIAEAVPNVHRWSHSGSAAGANAMYMRLPELGVGGVVLCNAAIGGIGSALAAAVNSYLPPAESPTVASSGESTVEAVTPGTLNALVGDYLNLDTGTRRQVTLNDSLLTVAMPSRFPLTQVGRDTFRIAGFEYRYTFERNPHGDVAALEESMNGAPAERFERIPEQSLSMPVARHAGIYWSEELGVAWELRAPATEDEVLVLRVPHYGEEPLQRVTDHIFLSQMGVLVFGPDASLTVSTDRARGLRFTRLTSD